MFRFSRKFAALSISLTAAVVLAACATPLNLKMKAPSAEDLPGQIKRYQSGANAGQEQEQAAWALYLAEGWTTDGKADWPAAMRYIHLALAQDSIAAHGLYGNWLALGKYGLAKNETEALYHIDRAYKLWLAQDPVRRHTYRGAPRQETNWAVSDGLVAKGLIAYYGQKDYAAAFREYCKALGATPGSKDVINNMKVVGKTPADCPK